MDIHHKRLICLVLIFLWTVVAGACAPPKQPAAPWPGAEWPISSPEDQAMDAELLDEMMALIDEREGAIDSVLVIRNGYLVFEGYRRNWKPTSRHHIQSVTKSFTSTLVGIALQEGLIEDLDQPLLDFYPGLEVANLDAWKEKITLRDLLTMSEGMDWHEVDLPYDDPGNSLGQMWGKADVIQHVLDQPMAREPGQSWNYNSGTSLLLGNIVEVASGQDILSFAEQYLFDPLGIEDLSWEKADSAHYHTDGGLHLLPRDMARLGYLMLRGGVWDGAQILPPEWADQATRAYFPTPSGLGYGYQWWVSPQLEIYSARGHYGQAIYVVPEADLVVVFTANIPDGAVDPEDGLLVRYILGACRDLPAGYTRLQYENYGFSLDHGAQFSRLEIPDPQSGLPSDARGRVQFYSISYPVELMIVSWDEAYSGLAPESVLAESLRELAEGYGLEVEEGEPGYLEVSGGSIPARRVSLEGEGIAFAGVSAVWPCGESQRGYQLTYLSDAGEDPPSLAARFQELFASFACQP